MKYSPLELQRNTINWSLIVFTEYPSINRIHHRGIHYIIGKVYANQPHRLTNTRPCSMPNWPRPNEHHVNIFIHPTAVIRQRHAKSSQSCPKSAMPTLPNTQPIVTHAHITSMVTQRC